MLGTGEGTHGESVSVHNIYRGSGSRSNFVSDPTRSNRTINPSIQAGFTLEFDIKSHMTSPMYDPLVRL